MNHSIWHVEFGGEAPFVLLAQVCGEGLLYDGGDGLIGIIWQWSNSHESKSWGRKCGDVVIGMMEDDFIAQKFLQLLDGPGSETILVL